jgi:phosphatidylglycerophosphatase C
VTDAPRPVVAAFDLDGTLTEGGSVFRWLTVVAGPQHAYRAVAALALPLLVGAVRSGPHADRAKERLFRRLLAGRDAAELKARSREFALAHLATRTRSDVAERLAWHREQGHHVVIVSASPELYVAVVAGAFSAEGFVGTRLEVDDQGRLTGGYFGANCRGEEKLARLVHWRQERGLVDAELYAYGNSRGDRRMLGAADHPFDVGRLGRLGALRNFPRLA